MGTSGSDRPREGLAETVPASEPDDAPPADSARNADRYRLGTELGRGGMGRVVEAFDVQLGRTVALKEVLPKGGPGTVRRFTREVQLTARLEHPSIVPLYDAGTGPDGRPYYVMRRVTGRPLDELIGRARGLGERLTLVPAVLAAIDAVAHAHRRGVIHRDLKPANILVGELGETVVIDWGLAKVIGEDDDLTGDSMLTPGDSLQTQMGSVFGTPGFMAPEQARGEELSTQGDVYALGATLYHLLAGTPPHAGNSATEVIDRTSRLEVRPLAETAPGAPHELVAIVGKALAFDPTSRYPNAGALGEDVRRFLSGQLVAAHNYTSRQKLARFARRHRGALAVAALATVAVAALAWFAVHRIVTERDVATEARHQALRDKQAAEDARDRLAERHDALVVMQANALLEQNPTEAAAILKQLSAKSPRLADARAIAQAATMRGVAWAMEGPAQMTSMAELSPDGKRLLQVTVDGVLRVWDLDARRLVIARPFTSHTRAVWIANGRLLAFHPKMPPQILDPTANTVEALALHPMSDAVPTADGDRVAFLGRGIGAGVLDLRTRTTRMLASEPSADSVAMSASGDVVVVGSKAGIVVFDGEGKELSRRLGHHAVVKVSRKGAVAAISDTQLFELQPSRTTWAEVPLSRDSPHLRPVAIMYRGEHLQVITSRFELLTWNGKTLWRRKQLETIGPTFREIGLDALLIGTASGKLDVLYPLGVATIALPHVVRGPRVAGRHDSTRFVLVGEGVILTYDIAGLLPKLLSPVPNTDAVFVGDDRLLTLTSIVLGTWEWRDVVSGKTIKLDPIEGLPTILHVDPTTGRVLVRQEAPSDNQPMQRLALLRVDRPEVDVIAEGPKLWGRLIGGDQVVFERGDGRVFARKGQQEPREVVKLDGAVRGLVNLGDERFAASSAGGEIVRMDLRTSKVERITVPVGTRGFVGTDSAHRVVIVEDNRLLVWDQTLTPVATFDKPVFGMDVIAGGVVVHFDDHEAQLVELVPNAKPHRLAPFARRSPVVDANGTLLVGLGNAQQLALVELPARARWTVPSHFAPHTHLLTVSPYTRRIVQGHPDGLVMWQLPSADGDLRSWLEAQTNAVVDGDGVLAWPWQVP